MTVLSDLQAKLKEAENILHQKMLGNQILTSSSPDGSVTYNQLSVTQLKSYISELKSQIAAESGDVATTRRAPMNFVHPN